MKAISQYGSRSVCDTQLKTDVLTATSRSYNVENNQYYIQIGEQEFDAKYIDGTDFITFAQK